MKCRINKQVAHDRHNSQKTHKRIKVFKSSSCTQGAHLLFSDALRTIKGSPCRSCIIRPCLKQTRELNIFKLPGALSKKKRRRRIKIHTNAQPSACWSLTEPRPGTFCVLHLKAIYENVQFSNPPFVKIHRILDETQIKFRNTNESPF